MTTQKNNLLSQTITQSSNTDNKTTNSIQNSSSSSHPSASFLERDNIKQETSQSETKGTNRADDALLRALKCMQNEIPRINAKYEFMSKIPEILGVPDHL